MNSINVNYMSGMYSKFLQNHTAQKGSTSFLDMVAQTAETKAATAATKTAATGAVVSAKDMSMEEYKQYVHNKISQMPMHPSQMSSNYSIQISDAGFEAMKNDPEYEQWVFDSIKANFDFNDPWAPICGGHYSILVFGATKDEGYGQGWYPGYMGGQGGSIFEAKSEGSFWERRTENHKRMMEETQEAYEKRRVQQKALAEAALSDKIAHQQLMAEWRMSELFNIGSTSSFNSGDMLSAVASPKAAAAIASYGANMLI